ncbi:uncharacterized protein G2W53_003521 [Senna tora]|uniref:Uncharacterized protein n=1 Tax=Senna tora TaxID=362788 RepID=A0A834X8Y1_9FABA|nr:uncharacterized protein G2W53_003521 [Senna tora]
MAQKLAQSRTLVRTLEAFFIALFITMRIFINGKF